MSRQKPICVECKQRECEQFNDYENGTYYDTRCSRCNDRQIEFANERAEWNHFHKEDGQ